jgi:glutamate-5-semialdehyde dehydrogenase
VNKPEELCRLAKQASLKTAVLPHEVRRAALKKMAAALSEHRDLILKANLEDRQRAADENLSPVLIKRLLIDEKKLEDMAAGLLSLARLPDPLGRKTLKRELDQGLILTRRTVPIGLVGVIFEARPEALVQIAGLCAKSGNALLAKGGREAEASNGVLHRVLREAQIGTSPDWENGFLLLHTREEINAILSMDEYIDLLIPRGSNQLVRHILDHTKIPVMGHAAGICAMYVDKTYDREKSLRLIRDGKTQYPAVCNAIETLLVHRESADILPRLLEIMPEVEIRGCGETQKIISCLPASSCDWETEYNDLILSVKIVETLQEAIDHINAHGSRHTDVILTEDKKAAEEFLNRVDSSSVMWNCSSRFADGYRYGFGAEVGIATGKIHARGPVGLEGLCIYKYILEGNGHIVDDYARGLKSFTHRDLI